MPKKQIERLRYIDHLIRKKATGSPSSLAEKLVISESRVNQLIRFMKDEGAPIAFDRYRNTYYYQEEGMFVFSFVKAG